jgi:hypothetical protein
MMPNITRGARMTGLMAYLAGPGRSNEHSEPHLVAGDAAIMAWHDESELDHKAALQIGWQLDQPRRAFGTRVTTAVKDRHGHNVAVKDAHVWHCSLSLRPDEAELSDERWAHICEEFVSGMGFIDAAGDEAACRWVAVRHGESKAGNDHVHVVVGLVREDGTKANVWHDRPRAQRLAGELERKYGLQILDSRQDGTGARGQKPAEVEVVVRDELAKTVRATAAASDNEAQFVSRMRQTPGVRIRPRFAAGREDVVTGYSVAWAAPGSGALTWHGGGSLSPELSLPKLRADWPDTPQHAMAAIPEWRAAKRNQRAAPSPATAAVAAPTTARDRLALTVRACAAAAGDEAEFVRRVRRSVPDVRIRPRFAKGSTTDVTGYSVALRDGPAAGVWYGGGHLARDLTLTRLRADWPATPETAAAAVSEWTAACRDTPTVARGRETLTPDPQMWARYTTEVTALREQLRSVPCDDRDLWAHVARETAGAFAAWSQSIEGGAPGPLADTARILARSAQLRAHQVRPQRAALPSARGAALLCASVAAGGSGTIAQTVLLKQLANTVKALHDAHQAAGDLRRANEIRDVVLQRLTEVHAALPAEPIAVGVADAPATEAARIAGQGQLPVRAPGSPVPGSLDVPPTRPVQRPGVQRPDRSEVDR